MVPGLTESNNGLEPSHLYKCEGSGLETGKRGICRPTRTDCTTVREVSQNSPLRRRWNMRTTTWTGCGAVGMRRSPVRRSVRGGTSATGRSSRSRSANYCRTRRGRPSRHTPRQFSILSRSCSGSTRPFASVTKTGTARTEPSWDSQSQQVVSGSPARSRRSATLPFVPRRGRRGYFARRGRRGYFARRAELKPRTSNLIKAF